MNQQSKKLAILLGVSKYNDNRLDDLNGVPNDLKELYIRLKNPNLGNFLIYQENSVINHIDQRDQPDCQFIREALHDAFLSDDEYDLVLFYFAGHGIRDGYDDGYIAPFDINLDKPSVNGIKMSDLEHYVSISRNKKTIIVILDCCYSGIATEMSRSSITPLNVNEFQKNIFQSEGKIILASGGADQRSREKLNCKHSENDDPHTHGNFTFHLIDALDGKGNSMDINGRITFGRICDHIERNMPIDQRPRLSIHNFTGFNDIIIGESNETLQNRMKQLKMSVEESLKLFNEQHSAGYLVSAIKLLVNLREITNDYNDISNYENKINGFLNSYNGRITTWLTTNSMIQGDIDRIKPGLYNDLYDLENYLQCSKLYTLVTDDLLSCLFHAICDVIANNRDQSYFRIRCTGCMNSYGKQDIPQNRGVGNITGGGIS